MIQYKLVDIAASMLSLLMETYEKKVIDYDTFFEESRMKVQFLKEQKEKAETTQQKLMILDLLDKYHRLIHLTFETSNI